ncbi:MAG: hypothetical protein J0L67_11425 [Cytophagales bacterium]|nr:hypothetical protein [Cytophagales bacterium]
MKTKLFVIIISIGIFLLGCVDTNISEQEKVDLLTNEIVSDAKFQEFFKSSQVFFSNKGNLSIDLDTYRAKISSISSSEVDIVVSQSFNHSKEILDELRKIDLFSIYFKQKYSRIYELSTENQQLVLTNALERLNDSIPSNNSASRTADQCSDQMSADKQTCFEASMVAGAVCGLLTPTLGGAAVCYLGVMAADIVCHNAAERDFAICRRFAP